MQKDMNLEVLQEFSAYSNFTVARTEKKFSKMGLDQRHKQLKKEVKAKQSWKPVTKKEIGKGMWSRLNILLFVWNKNFFTYNWNCWCWLFHRIYKFFLHRQSNVWKKTEE